MEIKKVRGPVKRDSLLQQHRIWSSPDCSLLKTTAPAQLPILVFNKDKESELAYWANQESKHNFGTVTTRPTALTQTINISQGNPPTHPISLGITHQGSSRSWVPCSQLRYRLEQVVVLGTPDIRLEAIITQCVICLLNGLFIKVCMMKSQAEQEYCQSQLGGSRPSLIATPPSQVPSANCDCCHHCKLWPHSVTWASSSHDVWKYLAFLPQVSLDNKPQRKRTPLGTGHEMALSWARPQD